MKTKIMWQRLRVTRAGLIRYAVIRSPGAEPYGAVIQLRRQTAEVRCVTADLRQMTEWVRLMAKGGVRPCHLRDVLEELLLR